MAELKPWQKEISEDEYKKELLSGNVRGVGMNAKLEKFYKLDHDNEEYQKMVKERMQKRRAKINKRIARARNIGFNQGKIAGRKEYINSKTFEKKLNAAYKKGVNSAKPQMNLQERIAKKQARILEEQKKLAELEQKQKVTA